MMDDVITMADMQLVYEVTDEFDIDREEIRVELGKEDPGSVERTRDGKWAITLPLSKPLPEWLPVLKAEIQRQG